MGRKLGAVPLLGAAGSPSNTMSPGPRSTSVLSGILIHPAVLPQQAWDENWGAVPLFWVRDSWVPIYHNVAWAKAYLHTKWHLNPSSHLATIDMGQKLEAMPLHFLGGWRREVGPHLRQCRLGQGLPMYQVAP